MSRLRELRDISDEFTHYGDDAADDESLFMPSRAPIGAIYRMSRRRYAADADARCRC